MVNFTQCTEFQKKVYRALLEIPKGRVMTYRSLSKKIEVNSAQAIGQALKRNPFSPEVPCHRVIKSNGLIGGFFGKVEGAEIEKKRELLESEGVSFTQDGKLIDSTLIL